MNLRLSSNQLRLRLSPSDLEIIQRDCYLEEKISITGSSLRFCLNLKTENFHLSFRNNQIEIQVAKISFLQWIESSEIEFDFKQANGDNEDLNVLIERDLKYIRGMK